MKLFGRFVQRFIFFFIFLWIIFVFGWIIYPLGTSIDSVKGRVDAFPHQYQNHISILNDLKDAMRHSWKAYTDYAWGMDEALLITHSGTRWMNAGLTIVDSLDTLWMFNMKREFYRARDWIRTQLAFDYDNDETSVFESTIRLLGGLLSAYHITGDTLFYTKAEMLGAKLITAFSSPSGLPYTNINFHTLKVSLPGVVKTVVLSEVATLQLEFNELAMLSRNKSFAVPAANVYKILDNVAKLSGLISYDINMYQPNLSLIRDITLGARADSYYEYLLKVWVQIGKTSEWLRKEYVTAVEGIKAKLTHRSIPNGRIYVGEIHNGKFSPKMDHLVCFLPGTLAYGYLHGMPVEHLYFAESLMETCFHLYNFTKTGLSPEIALFNMGNPAKPDVYIRRADTFNLLRPETTESLFYLYRITKNPKYREWGVAIFRAFNTSCRVNPAGFAPIDDVQSSVPTHGDRMQSFWIAETLKYLLLLFDDNMAEKFNLKTWVFNTEAHPFPLLSSDALSVIQDLYNINP